MSEESLTQTVARQLCHEAYVELRRLVKKWERRANQLKRKGVGFVWKHSIFKSSDKVVLMLEIQPSEWTIRRERAELYQRIIKKQ